MSRWYIRCRDCLAVAAIEVDSVPRDLKCPCGGNVLCMGRVFRDRLVRDHQDCPCDTRCTNASGPNCDCQCGGANHGSGMLVTVTRDAGGIPRAEIPPNSELAVAWRKALDDATAKAHTTAAYAAYEHKQRGEWVSNFQAYLDYCSYLSARRAAKARTSHKGRMKVLAEALAIIGA